MSKKAATNPRIKPKLFYKSLVVVFIVLVAMSLSANKLLVDRGVIKKPTTTPKLINKAPVVVSQCAGNNVTQLVIVSISQRHMWACDATTLEYNSAVVTGYEADPEELTPVGTYQIYGKETDLHLIGSDNRGSWNDYVNYWMPFLDNQYGAYGFHDATWRAPTDFGNISADSPNASHGCVEMPLAAAAWLYSWAQIGTSVDIEA